MSGRVCYLGRGDRGAVLAQVRLVSVNGDESWEGSMPGDDPAEVAQRIADAAAWTAERAARGDGPRGEIGVLCVDVEGSTCAWLTAPSSDPSIVAAVLQQGDEWGGAPPPGVWATPSQTEASLQALAPPPERAKRNGKAGSAHAKKLAVLAVPDVSARLFIDALDDRGVFVDRAVSLWHALAMAWDPAGPAAAGSLRGGDRVVATSAPVTAVVVADPEGRLVWAWSRGGELIAAGTIRLATEGHGDEPALVIGQPEIARLTADWIAWSLQLGVTPARILCVGPQTAEGAGGMSQQELGLALGRSWPGATVDLAVHEDPIGATLRRLAGLEEEPAPGDPRHALVDLSRRPGRAHRAVYRWASLAVLAGAAGLVAVAWRTHAAAVEAREAQARLREETVAEVLRLVPPANQLEEEAAKGNPLGYLMQHLNTRRQALAATSGIERPKPILNEMDSLAMVLGSAGEGVALDELRLQHTLASLYIAVPDTRTGEEVVAALRSIAGSNIEWGRPMFNAAGTSAVNAGKQTISIQGTWKQGAEAPAGGAP